MLDAKEYLHLAINSSQNGDHQKALEQLHASIELDSTSGIAFFLLGAEYAELGLSERAVSNLEKSLELDPNIEMAYLQLGMLHGQAGNNDKAVEYLEALVELSSLEYFQKIAGGLSMLCQEKPEAALAMLREGVAKNTDNPALNESIERVVAGVVAANAAGESEGKVESESNVESESKVESEVARPTSFLGAYRNSAVGETANDED